MAKLRHGFFSRAKVAAVDIVRLASREGSMVDAG